MEKVHGDSPYTNYTSIRKTFSEKDAPKVIVISDDKPVWQLLTPFTRLRITASSGCDEEDVTD